MHFSSFKNIIYDYKQLRHDYFFVENPHENRKVTGRCWGNQSQIDSMHVPPSEHGKTWCIYIYMYILYI